jgi:hypothetical protein
MIGVYMDRLPEPRQSLEIFVNGEKKLATDRGLLPRRLAFELKQRFKSEEGELPPVVFVVEHDKSDNLFKNCPVVGQYVADIEDGAVVVRRPVRLGPERLVRDNTRRY